MSPRVTALLFAIALALGAFVFLYELGIFLSALIYRGKAQREKELEADLTPPPGSLEAQ